MSKDRRLGRGLAALLGTPLDESGSERPAEVSTTQGGTETSPEITRISEVAPLDDGETSAGGTSGLLHLNVYEIDDNPFQPRRDFSESEIGSLSESLKEHDMLQPILVRQVSGRYQLISGERRLRAAIQAGWSTVPARVREADDRLVAELAIVENLQRKDLNPVEKAMSFKRYLDEHGCAQDDLARRLKIDRSTISNLMRLLELPPQVLDALRGGAISAGHARALLPLGEDSEQIEFASRIQREGISVRETERYVQGKLADADGGVLGFQAAGKSQRKRSQSGHIASLEQELRVALGTRVEIRQTSRGRGKITIHFHNHDEFDRVRDLLSGGSNDTDMDAA
ncbi:MAG: ParB/RepB/Spo0J family partition protein [Pirellulaceae bacterium]